MPTQQTVTIRGTEYTLQHPGARWWLQYQNRIQAGGGTVDVEKMADELLENVVVDPPDLSVDSFEDDTGAMMELVREINSFLRA